MSKGILTQNGVHLKKHEYNTVKVLLEQGLDIELIPPSHIKGYKTPDIMMGGIPWEMKSPEGGSRTTIKHNISDALKQSRNVIIDLQRCHLEEDYAIKELEKEFKLSKRIRKLKIVLKDRAILDYSK